MDAAKNIRKANRMLTREPADIANIRPGQDVLNHSVDPSPFALTKRTKPPRGNALRVNSVSLYLKSVIIFGLKGKAKALVQLNRLPEAEKVIQEITAIDGRSWQAYLLLGTVYDRQKRYEEATVAYRKVLDINPKSASAYNNLGVSLFLMSKYRESADALLSAISLDSSNLQSYNNLGLSLFKLGKYPEALDPMKPALLPGLAACPVIAGIASFFRV
jgi:Flp pilus assembly protein TadD